MLSKMKIGTRLFLGFGVVILLSIILAFFAIYAISSLNDITEKIYKHPLAVSNAVRDIKIQIVSIHRTMKDVVLVKDKQALSEKIAIVDQREQQVFKLFQLVEDRFLGDQQNIKDAYNAFKDWKVIRDEVIALMKNGKQEQAAAITMGKGARHVDFMNLRIKVMMDFANNKAAEFRRNANNTRTHWLIGMILLFTMIVIIGTYISYVIFKSIMTPLENMSDVTRELAKGNFTARCNFETRDELYDLCISLNSMASEIEQMNQTLEARVEARTNELNRAVEDLKHVIAKQKLVEEELTRSEAHLRYLFDSNMTGIVYWDSNGQITDANERFLSIVGYTQEDLGKGLLNWKKLTPSEYEHMDAIAMREIAERGTCTPFEKEYIRKDGTRVPVILNCSSLMETHNRGIAIIVDMSALKKITRELRRSEEKYRTYVENSPIGIMVFNHGQLVDINPSAQKLTGYTATDLMGISIEEMFNNELINEIKNTFENNLQLKLIDVETELQNQEQGFIPVSFNAVNLSDGSLMVFCSDISERKKAQTDKELLEQQLRQSQKMEAVGKLAGGIAHDFNNLLTGISGNLHLAQMDNQDNEELVELLDEMGNATDRASKLVAQLLAFSRKQIITLKVFDINDLILNMKTMLARLIGENIELVMNLSNAITSIKADPIQMEQVILNLAVNAKDAMPNGGRLTIQTDQFEVSEEFGKLRQISTGHYIMLSVIDTGHGMDKNIIKNIFDPFYTTKDVDQGTGLGLSTVYGIAKQHNGHIDAVSTRGKGSTFRVYLPVCEEVSERQNAKQMHATLPTGTETIMVVEDENMVRNIATKILKRQGYCVLEASNGKEALQIFNDQKPQIDCLMTDVIMPGINGKELADNLMKQNPKIKILFTSGYTENIFSENKLLDKDVEFLPKPYSPHALADKIRNILDK